MCHSYKSDLKIYLPACKHGHGLLTPVISSVTFQLPKCLMMTIFQKHSSKLQKKMAVVGILSKIPGTTWVREPSDTATWHPLVWFLSASARGKVKCSTQNEGDAKTEVLRVLHREEEHWKWELCWFRTDCRRDAALGQEVNTAVLFTHTQWL